MAFEDEGFLSPDLASLLYRRALQSFQGAVLMAERGMIADALTLVRSCAETAIARGSVAGDEKFVDALVEAHDEAILTYSNVLLNDPESRQFFTSFFYAGKLERLNPS
jgi:hypothetical protein